MLYIRFIYKQITNILFSEVCVLEVMIRKPLMIISGCDSNVLRFLFK